jgi:hypothetical protein
MGMSYLGELREACARVLVNHYPNWEKPGVCRCGLCYGQNPCKTWAQHAAERLFPTDDPLEPLSRDGDGRRR